MYKPMRKVVNDYLKENITKNDIVVDGTIGNGNDTLLLAQLAKFVYGFDIQEKAITITENLLKSNNMSNYKLICDTHLNIYNYVTSFKGIVFNLGYLPKGDKTITTKALETIKTLTLITKNISSNNFILITVYPGHEEGKVEATLINNFLTTLSNDFIITTHVNKDNSTSPFVVIIKKV